MTEKSIIDTINEIHAMLNNLNDKFEIMNKNISILHNKMAMPEYAKINNPTVVALEEAKPIKKETSSKSTGARVYGKVYNADKKPVPGTIVKVSDANNKLIKSIKSNIDGGWEVNLMPGKYSIKYLKEGTPPSYRLVSVKVDDVSIEVI